jgi:hypothetical protein
MANSINIKTIKKLLKLYQQFLNSITPMPPEKNKELWEQCLKQSKKEYINELKEHEKYLSSKTPSRKISKKEEKDFEKTVQYITTKNAEKKYRQMDMKYNEVILKKEKRTEELIREIDHLQYSINDLLIEFDRVQGTLLLTNWQELKQNLPMSEIKSPNFQFYIEKSIDALEAIKCKVKQQQPRFHQKIIAFLWNLYKTTLEAYFSSNKY